MEIYRRNRNQEARRYLKKFSVKNLKEQMAPMDGGLIVG